jgi:glycosyltransferase involved in cell wall biosynthesis
MKNKITIAIPCYNAEKYIDQTIQSVLNQSYKNFIFLIIDNNSKDKTVKIIKKFKDRRIKIIRNKKNIGMFQNMNKCIKLTKTPYLKILASDDLISPNCLEENIKILEKYPSVNLVYNSSIVINEKGKYIFTRKYFNKDKKINGGVLINLILKSGRNPIGEPSCVTFRTKIVKKKRLYFNTDFKYVSDLDFWIKILKNGDAYYINKVLNFFRLHKTSATTSLFKKAIQEHSKIISLYSEEFNLNLVDLIIINLKLFINLIIKYVLIKFI